MTPDEACAELARCSGTQFDPDCVRALDEAFGGAEATRPSPAAPHRLAVASVAPAAQAAAS